MITLAASAFALVLHVTLGWAWTPLAAVVGGWLYPARAARRGALALGLAWGALVAWGYALDSATASRAMGLVAGLFGGMPGAVAVVLTLLVALLLGALAGTAGAAARHLRPAPAGTPA